MDSLKILDCGRYFTVINTKGAYDHHCHVKKYSTAEMLCRLINKKRVPKSKYLRESCKRGTLDKRYIEKINVKIEKDNNRQYYFNSNKGVRK